MEVLYIMYVEIERNVRGYQVVTLCNGIRKVYCADRFGSGVTDMLKILKIPHRVVKHETAIAR